MKAFYERKESIYHDTGASIGERERRVLECFPPRRGLRVFDVGCGSGRFLRILKDLGHDPVGMDLSEAAVATATQSGVVAYSGRVDSPADLDRAGKDFDVVTALDVLEHTFDPSQILRQLVAVVRPGGCLIASVPNVGCLSGRLTVLMGRFPATASGIFDSGHIRFFTRSNLADYVNGSGAWELQACTGTPLPPWKRFGLWRLERPHQFAFSRLARFWPALFGYQLVFRLGLKPRPA